MYVGEREGRQEKEGKKAAAAGTTRTYTIVVTNVYVYIIMHIITDLYWEKCAGRYRVAEPHRSFRERVCRNLELAISTGSSPRKNGKQPGSRDGPH